MISAETLHRLALLDVQLARMERRNGLPVGGPRRFRPCERAVCQAYQREIARLTAALNTPEIADFAAGVVAEAQHQRERWGTDHDDGKNPFDWFWLLGFLSQKAASAALAGDLDKARHHTISTAAALANWHAALTGQNCEMRPGIATPEGRHD